MPKSILRFVLDEAGNIIDTVGNFPPLTFCQRDCCEIRNESKLNNQIYLRRLVLNAELSALSQRMESLCEAEAHSLAQVIYGVIFVSKLDLTIGQVQTEKPSAEVSNAPAGAPADCSSIVLFLCDVDQLIRDLYCDCDQQLLGDILESVTEIAIQWDRVRTAASRGFLQRLSQEINVPIRRLDENPRAHAAIRSMT